MNCVNSLEDLLNLYSNAFANCNYGLREVESGRYAPRTEDSDNWFKQNTNVHVVLPDTDAAPEFSDAEDQPHYFPLWKQERKRFIRRLMKVFRDHNWKDEEGHAVAPSPQTIATLDGSATKLWSNFLPDAQPLAYLKSLFPNTEKSYRYVKSHDVCMDAAKIMRDLVASALGTGNVTIECSADIERVFKSNYGLPIAKSVTYSVPDPSREGSRMRKSVRAKVFVVCSGAATNVFAKNEFPFAGKSKSVLSSMLIAHPPFGNVNFVRMSYDQKWHFNHFFRQYRNGNYSILADSWSVKKTFTDQVLM